MAKAEQTFPTEGVLQFAQIIKSICEQNGWSRRDFARNTGITQGTFTNWLQNLNPNRDPSDKYACPSNANIMALCDVVRNPETGQSMTASRLFAICSGEQPISDEHLQNGIFGFESSELSQEYQADPVVSDSSLDSQSKQPDLPPNYEEIVRDYWDNTILPNVDYAIAQFGEPQQDGSLQMESREYTYIKNPEGDISINPKDGRPPLQPLAMNKRDWDVMNALSEKVEKGRSQSLEQPKAKAMKL